MSKKNKPAPEGIAHLEGESVQTLAPDMTASEVVAAGIAAPLGAGAVESPAFEAPALQQRRPGSQLVMVDHAARACHVALARLFREWSRNMPSELKDEADAYLNTVAAMENSR